MKIKFYLFRAHYAAVLLALAIAGISVAPQIYFAHTNVYRGLQILGADAEYHYLARVEETNDGHPACGDTFLPDKNVPYLTPCLGEMMQAWAGDALHLSVQAFNTLAKFVFPFLIVLVLYALGIELFGSRAAALIGSGMAVVGYNLIGGPSQIWAVLHGTTPFVGFLTFTRPINPEISSLMLFVGVLIFYRGFLARRAPRWWEALAVGALAGALVYVSIFPASFLLGIASLSLVWFLYRKEYRLAAMCTVPIVVGAALTVPFLLNFIALNHDPNYLAAGMRQGLVATHAPLVGWWLVIMLALALFAWPKRLQNARLLFGLSAVALLILTNQQIITGQFIEPSHYHWYMTKPLVGLLVGMYAVVFAEYAVHSRAARATLYAAACLFLLYNAAVIQIHSYRAQYAQAAQAQAYAPALAYLRGVPGEQYVWADEEFSLYVPVYTRHDVADNLYDVYYVVPERHLVERLLLLYRLQGVAPADILAVLKQNRAHVSSSMWGIYWRDKNGTYESIPDSVLERYAAQYPAFYRKPLGTVFKDMGITMIVWDRTAEPSWRVDAMPFANEVFESGDISVYRLSY